MTAGSRSGRVYPVAGDVQQRFAVALRTHQAGQLAEAERLYRQILSLAPDHDESLHLLGVLACQAGRADAAAVLIEQAIGLRDTIPVYHYNLGLARQMQGRPALAALAFEAALVLQPDYVEAHNNLAVVLMLQDRFEAAIAAFERALTLQPDHVEACCNLGTIRYRQGAIDAAIALFRRSVALRPDYQEAHAKLAASLLDRAVAGQSVDLAGRHPRDPLVQRNALLAEAGRHYDHAIRLQPSHFESWYGLGSTLQWQGRPADAERCYETAIALSPDFAEARSNLAVLLKDRGDIAGALAQLDRALAFKPDFAAAQLNRGMMRLLTGDFAGGWLDFEARWQTPQLDPDRRDLAMPRWDGAAGAGGTLLLWAEQGLGDTLQFCRYATLAAERGWHIILEVPPSLVRLLQGLAGVRTVPLGTADLSQIDTHCPLMSLPLLFGTVLATIPAAIPYLGVAPDEIARWRRRLGDGGAALEIGLVWAGNPGTLSALHDAVDRRRSIAPADLAPLFAVPGTRFVSLQQEHRSGEAPAALGIVDVMAEIEDFADTAAIIAGLDLVISVDTSVVHLAGALGKPVWLLNRADPCWRWLQGRDDSPWYPTLRQFRQPAPGDWHGVIGAVQAALAARLRGV